MELTIKKTVEETINVEFPIFLKNPISNEYIGVINDSNFIKFMQGTSTSSLINSKLSWWESEFLTAFRTWDRISEDDFMSRHEQFLAAQSLKPEIILLTDNPDDIRGVF